MGGNAKAINSQTGEVIASAQKIDLRVNSRASIKKDIISIIHQLNRMYVDVYGVNLWSDFCRCIAFGEAFAGSSESFFDSRITDDEFKTCKPLIGDIDIMVEHCKLKNLWFMLKDSEGKPIGNSKYLGQNKLTMRVTDQINAVFETRHGNIQIDFEGAEYEEGVPTEWAKFSHNSKWEDIKKGFKGVAHKYFLTNLVRSISKRDDIVILTPKSKIDSPETAKLKKMDAPPRMMAFSVTRGLRNKYTPVGLEIKGKQAYKEIPVDESEYITDLETLFQIVFEREPERGDMKQFESFNGCLALSSRCLKLVKTMDDLLDYLIVTSLWGPQAQALESDDAKLDFNVKYAMVLAIFEHHPHLRDKYIPIIDELSTKYYEDFASKKWGE